MRKNKFKPPRRGFMSVEQSLGPKVKPKRDTRIKQADGAPRLSSDGWGRMDVSSRQIDYFTDASISIGPQQAATLATNWLVDKCCLMPARDAIRNGYTLGSEYDDLRKTDRKYGVNRHLQEMVHMGRVYGGRVVLFDVSSANPDEWYANPFNPDGVTIGSYKGMVQIDLNWLTPVLTDANVSDPTQASFYKPSYWSVAGKTVHSSHLHIYVPFPVPDYLKPAYNYLGISLPQRIVDRVYAAERAANEAPGLLTTKRLIGLQVSGAAMANMDALESNLQNWSDLMNNYGIKVYGDGEALQQFDTSLSDVERVIMTQYQLVAAVAGVPATKLLGTQTTGLATTGEADKESYREELESIQTGDLEPLLLRHYQLVALSKGMGGLPDLGVQWMPLDSPTAEEWAAVDKLRAERDAVLFGTGAIDAQDIRTRLIGDQEGDYYGIEEGEVDEDAYGQAGAMGEGAGSELSWKASGLSGRSDGEI